MSSVFPRGVKDLKISGPTSVGSSASSLRCNVILVAKFDFDAETDGELSVKKGDVLKLLDRLANGWVLVEFIDKISASGLVPSLYVDIAVNDPVNPVTLSWLHEVNSDGSNACKTFNDIQVQMLLEKNSPFSINNKLYPLSVSVTNYLMYENRFWYRVDVTYSSGEQGYLCRYYSDFYDLHLALLDHLNSSEKKPGSTSKLPKLPEPVPSQKRNSADQKQLFSHRCRGLSTYMNELISTKQFQVCPALVDWLDVQYKDLPGFVVDDTPQESGDVIDQRILPGSVILASKTAAIAPTGPAQESDISQEEAKYVTPSKDAFIPNKPKNVYNHYQQAANAKINIARSLSTSEGRYPARNGSKVERARTISATHNAARKTEHEPGLPSTSPKLHKSQSVKVPSVSKKESPYSTPKQRFAPELPQIQTPPLKIMSPNTSSASAFIPANSNGGIHRTPNGGSSGGSNGEKNGEKNGGLNGGKNGGKNVFSSGQHSNAERGSKNGFEGGSAGHTGSKTPSSSHSTPRQVAGAVFPPRKVSFGTPTTAKPQSPSSACQPTSTKLARCEIKTQTADSVVVRVNLEEVFTIEAFKAAIYSKFAFNNLFIRLNEGEAYEEIDTPEIDVMGSILSSKTVYLLAT